jgi:3-oxoacyl-[acyl-carrier protein] reductase
MEFSDRVAVITGSARGIGRRIAEKLAAEGAAVFICDLNAEAARNTAEAIGSTYGVKTAHCRVDVQSADDIQKLMDTAIETFGSIDILVNNAGICPITPVEAITPEEWNRVISVNLTGVFFCSQRVMPIMKRQGRGKILNLGSIAGKAGGVAAGAHYSASKAGVICLTKVFAKLLASSGVTVNALAPGPVDTDMIKDFPEDSWKILKEQSPLGRIADTDDIADAAVFLLSDRAKHITGETLNINGGLLMD